jgi:hypothetical protein
MLHTASKFTVGPVAGPYEHSNEPSDFKKCGEILH